MKRTLCALAIAALVWFPAPPPMRREFHMHPANFTGIVDQTQGKATGESIGSTVASHFDLDSSPGNFLDFSIAGRSVAPGYLSFASIGPTLFDAIYTAQVSPVASGVPSNSSFTLDLSLLSTWPSTDTAYTLLTDENELTTNLDTVDNPLSAFPSTFSYYTANADGTNVVALDADLTSITATAAAATPEPGSFALLGCSLLFAGLLARRRRSFRPPAAVGAQEIHLRAANWCHLVHGWRDLS